MGIHRNVSKISWLTRPTQKTPVTQCQRSLMLQLSIGINTYKMPKACYKLNQQQFLRISISKRKETRHKNTRSTKSRQNIHLGLKIRCATIFSTFQNFTRLLNPENGLLSSDMCTILRNKMRNILICMCVYKHLANLNKDEILLDHGSLICPSGIPRKIK